jgi:hypothetical protein
MNRSRNITDKDVACIVELLDGWTGRLTWDRLLEAIEKRIFARYTRQALHNYPRIKDAFAQRKMALANSPAGVRKKTVGPPELVLALERIERLTAENQRLEAENGRLPEQVC